MTVALKPTRYGLDPGTGESGGILDDPDKLGVFINRLKTRIGSESRPGEYQRLSQLLFDLEAYLAVTRKE